MKTFHFSMSEYNAIRDLVFDKNHKKEDYIIDVSSRGFGQPIDIQVDYSAAHAFEQLAKERIYQVTVIQNYIYEKQCRTDSRE